MRNTSFSKKKFKNKCDSLIIGWAAFKKIEAKIFPTIKQPLKWSINKIQLNLSITATLKKIKIIA